MTILYRPLHNSFDAKRLSTLSGRTSGGYHHFGSLNDDSVTPHLLRPTRPASTFAPICAR